ncbi:MAG: HNH endonuclease [Propionibacteriaceae bacterium]|nr:HNH endonuclease [Propionibacteriaceae bacterium]
MDSVDHDLVDAEWTALVEAWGGCAYCGAASDHLQRDCVLPISRGGRYTLTNVVPACRSCNASKCNQEVTTWLRRKKMDERAFLTNHVRVLADLAARYSGGSGAGTPAAPLPFEPAG